MRRAFFAASAAATAALLLAGAGRHEGGRERDRDKGGSGRAGGRGAAQGVVHAPTPTTVYKRHRVPVARPEVPAQGVLDHRRAAYPQRDESGGAISSRAERTPPSRHRTITGNSSLVRGIERQQRLENAPNHYYWHHDGGVRYSHYYDGSEHWYGFYHGPTFYWTRYHGGRWWWYDAGAARWDFWWNGFWWWPGPSGVPYAYVDNNYYPYENEAVIVQSPVIQAPPANAPSPTAGTSTVSPDGRRLVQVLAPGSQAFLYSKTGVETPVFLKYLGDDVTAVKFSGGKAGARLQILLQFKDATYALYDENGESLSEEAVSVSSGTVAPEDTPTSLPPPPTSAPGQ